MVTLVILVMHGNADDVKIIKHIVIIRKLGLTPSCGDRRPSKPS